MIFRHEPSSGQWIGVDLDGTLAHYDGWNGVTHIGHPIPKMIAHVKEWLEQGWEVRIFTARISDPKVRDLARTVIEQWAELHIGQKLEVTCEKDFAMMVLFDDRAIQVEQNTGDFVLAP